MTNLNKKIKIIISETSKSNYDDYFGIMNVNNINEEIGKIRNVADFNKSYIKIVNPFDI